MNTIRTLASQTAIYGVSTIVGRLLNYLLVPLYTRVFQPAEYGVVTELYAYAAFLAVVYTYGMETAFFRFSEKEKNPEKVFSTSWGSLFISSLLISGALILSADYWSRILEYESHPEYIVWFVCIIALDTLATIPFARLRQQQKAIQFAGLKLLNIAINIGLNIFFLVVCPRLNNHWEVIGVIYDDQIGVGYVFISNLVASTVTLLVLLPIVFRHRFIFDISLWKQMIGYALPLLVVGFAGMTDEMLGRAILKWLLPYGYEENLRQLGIYGANYKLAVLIALFTQAYRFAAEPLFFSRASHSGAPQLYARMMKFYVLVQGIFFLVIVLYLDVFQYFIGRQYREGLHVVPVLLLAQIALGIYYNLSVWYKLTDLTRLGALIAVGGALLTLVLNIILIPWQGYAGSAWATLICYATLAFVSWHLGQRYLPIDYRWYQLLLYLLIAVLIYVVSTSVRAYFSLSVPHSLMLNTLFLMLYVIWLWRAEGSKIIFIR